MPNFAIVCWVYFKYKNCFVSKIWISYQTEYFQCFLIFYVPSHTTLLHCTYLLLKCYTFSNSVLFRCSWKQVYVGLCIAQLIFVFIDKNSLVRRWGIAYWMIGFDLASLVYLTSLVDMDRLALHWNANVCITYVWGGYGSIGITLECKCM